MTLSGYKNRNLYFTGPLDQRERRLAHLDLHIKMLNQTINQTTDTKKELEVNDKSFMFR